MYVCIYMYMCTSIPVATLPDFKICKTYIELLIYKFYNPESFTFAVIVKTQIGT